MKITIAIVLPILLFCGCKNGGNQSSSNAKPAKSSYTINGTIQGVDSDRIIICYSDRPSNGVKIDSAEIRQGKFELSGTFIAAGPFLVGIRHKEIDGRRTYIFYHGPFILDSGNLIMEGNKDLSVLHAHGTKGQDEFNEFKQATLPRDEAMNRIAGEQFHTKKGDKKQIDSLNNAYRLNNVELCRQVAAHVKRYPASNTSAFIVSYFLASNPDVATFKPIYTLFTADVKNSSYGKLLTEKIQALDRTLIGATAPDFVLQDKNDKQVALRSFRGKWTLIDFWASWCQPCRKQNPNLIEAYAGFKNKGFEIISVSVDVDKKAWLNAVQHDGLSWPQVIDPPSKIRNLYGVKGIPMNYLLDKDGRIVASDLRDGDLEKKLAELIK